MLALCEEKWPGRGSAGARWPLRWASWPRCPGHGWGGLKKNTVALEGKEGPEAGVVWGEEPLQFRPGPAPDSGPPVLLGPALLLLDARWTLWQAPACGPSRLPVFLCLLFQALCDPDSHPPTPFPTAPDSQPVSSLIPQAKGRSPFPECPLCPSHCAHLPCLLGLILGPVYPISLKCMVHPAVSSQQPVGANAIR